MADPASWHSHVYFDAHSHPRAEALVAALRVHFGPEAAITYGRWHHKPVGPHPDFSIQLAFGHELFAAVTTFLALNRDGLTSSPIPTQARLSRMSFATIVTTPSGWGWCDR